MDTNINESWPGFTWKRHFTMNSYIPYVGLQVKHGDGLVFRVIRFPRVPGVSNGMIFEYHGFRRAPHHQLISVSNPVSSSKSSCPTVGSLPSRWSQERRTYNGLTASTVTATEPSVGFLPGSNSFSYVRQFLL